MPLENRKRKIYLFASVQLNFEQVYISWEQNKKKIQRLFAEHETSIFMPYFQVWKVCLENIEDKVLGLQIGLVSAKWTRPSYHNGSDQDEAETQHDRLISQEWCNNRNCEKMPTSLVCVCCHKMSEVKVLYYLQRENLSRCSTKLIHFMQNLTLPLDCRQSKYSIFKTWYFSFQTIFYKYKIHEKLTDYVANYDNN